jgi:hypothetical protein
MAGIAAECKRSTTLDTPFRLGVFIDTTAPPGARYKAVSQGIWSAKSPPYRITGVVSPDGINWTRLSQPFNANFADSPYAGFWDPRIEKHFVAKDGLIELQLPVAK